MTKPSLRQQHLTWAPTLSQIAVGNDAQRLSNSLRIESNTTLETADVDDASAATLQSSKVAIDAGADGAPGKTLQFSNGRNGAGAPQKSAPRSSSVEETADEDETEAFLTWMKEKKNEDEAEGLLPEDTFSLMAVAPLPSWSMGEVGWSFLLGLGVFLLQICTLILLTLDIMGLGKEDSNSWFDLPAFVTPTVRVAQIVAIFIAIISQTDVVWSMNIFMNNGPNTTDPNMEGPEHGPSKSRDIPPKKNQRSIFLPFSIRRSQESIHVQDTKKKIVGTWEYISNEIKVDVEDEAEHSITNESNDVDIEGGVETRNICNSEEAESDEPDIKSEKGVKFSMIEGDIKDSTTKVGGWQWHIANLCRFLQGFYCLVVTFALIMQSQSVRDLLLNFTAAEFISNVDNMVFLLAKWRYFGRDVRKDARNDLIAEDTFTVHGSDIFCCNSKRSISSTSAALSVIFLFFFALWIFLSHKQGSGIYLAGEIHVQFGDDELRTLGLDSGKYTRMPIDRPGLFLRAKNIVYKSESNGMMFQYCADGSMSSSWVFANEDEKDACKDGNWIAKTAEADTFNIPSEDMQWFVRVDINNNTHIEKLQTIRIRGKDSLSKREPCDYVELEVADIHVGCWANLTRTQDRIYWKPVFEEDKNGRKSKAIRSYNRPVYARPTEHGVSLLLSVGRHWAHVYVTKNNIAEAIKNTTKEIKQYFEIKSTNANSNVTLGKWAFLSEPFDFESPEDSVSPKGLRFYRPDAADPEGLCPVTTFDESTSPDSYIGGLSCETTIAPTDHPTEMPSTAPSAVSAPTTTSSHPTTVPSQSPSAAPSQSLMNREKCPCKSVNITNIFYTRTGKNASIPKLRISIDDNLVFPCVGAGGLCIGSNGERWDGKYYGALPQAAYKYSPYPLNLGYLSNDSDKHVISIITESERRKGKTKNVPVSEWLDESQCKTYGVLLPFHVKIEGTKHEFSFWYQVKPEYDYLCEK